MMCSPRQTREADLEGPLVTSPPGGRTTHQRIADLVADGLWLEYVIGHYGLSDSEINEAVDRVVNLAMEGTESPS